MRALWGAAALALFLLLAWWVFRVEPEPQAPTATAPARVELRRPSTPSNNRRPSRPVPAAPTPSAPPTPAAPAGATAAAGEASDAPPSDGPVDRRPPEQQDGGGLQATVKEMMDFASEGIEACIQDWGAREPGRAGIMEIGFEFDADGLTTAWVDEEAGVPEVTRDCLSQTIYDIDWSGLTASPVMVTWGFSYETTGR